MAKHPVLSNDLLTVRRLLQTADGQVLLRYLRDLYDGDKLADIASEKLTYMRLGSREVYRELLFQSERGQSTD